MPAELTSDEMQDEAAVAPQLRAHTRVRHGLRRPHNWYQLVKFCVVGGSGYVVNLCVFTACVALLDMHHLAAATVAFVVAVANNFWWNRHWTFGATGGRKRFQAARFFAVSVLAFLFAAAILELLVSNGMQEILAQAISIVAATPLNFVGNKMWSFARSAQRP
jgi:dolichol-phosphate mannosyltransferase